MGFVPLAFVFLSYQVPVRLSQGKPKMFWSLIRVANLTGLQREGEQMCFAGPLQKGRDVLC